MVALNAVNHVLLIDDDEVTNFLNKKIIEKIGGVKNITVATNGFKGIEIIRNISEDGAICPELILLDLNMPVMNGFEFLDIYDSIEFENKDNVRIIILTSSSNPADIKKIQERNLIYMTKPLTEKAIGEYIRSHF
jgi:CheY-like chemotaxis protein